MATTRFTLPGQACVSGMALGRARLIRPAHFAVSEETIPARRVPEEIARFEQALVDARHEIGLVRQSLTGSLAKELGEMLDTPLMLLSDPVFIDAVRSRIQNESIGAHAALKRERDRLLGEFAAIEDPYLRSRGEDIEQAIGRVVSALYRDTVERIDPATLAGEIVVADQVEPSEQAQWLEHGLLGLVTVSGSSLSHSAILARSQQLPMLCGVEEALSRIHDGDVLLLDGVAGQIVVHPNLNDQRRFERWQLESERDNQALARLRKVPTRSRDGTLVNLWANAERLEDIQRARAMGVAGVGLYRTEFLFLQRVGLPDEEEQYQTYATVMRAMRGRPVTIRTLDIGADKADRSGLALSDEPNPALGLRGVRLSLARPEILDTQLRAILRASALGPIRILIPMVTHTGELAAVRRRLRVCTRQLVSAGHELGERIELGAMIETPAAAIAIDPLLKLVDFVSIGTNDLSQYLLAADRNNDAVIGLYENIHPAMVFLLERIAAAAVKAGKSVTVCGEMAGDPRQSGLLLRAGIRDLSMHPSSLLAVRRAIATVDLSRD